jgi:hypothetical protein
MSQQAALAELERFEKRGDLPAFKRLSRSAVAADLKARVTKPYLINQGTKAGVCGPASIAYEIMRTRPLTYVRAATSLFQFGFGWIDTWKIEPDDDLKNAPCPTSVAQGDWVMLASIRDSENWWYDFHSDTSGEEAGTTLEEIEAWMKHAGFQNVVRDQTITGWLDREPMFKDALRRFDGGAHVTLAIDASCINSGIPDSPKMNHVVVLRAAFVPPPNRSATIKIPIFTWGEETSIPATGGLTYGQFLGQFFGYVAAEDKHVPGLAAHYVLD